jgi:hypothetical protein
MFLASIPPSAEAQILNCPDCVLGIYDDEARTSTFGTASPNMPKQIYLGIDYGPPLNELSGIEFSVSGMRNVEHGIFIMSVDWVNPPFVIIGPGIQAPADTSATSMGVGGVTAAWAQCQLGSRTLARITFISFAAQVNRVFQVKRKYPPSNLQYNAPVVTKCNDPIYTTYRVHGGCYILNWNGDPSVLACLDGPVAVEQRAWSGVKALYR